MFLAELYLPECDESERRAVIGRAERETARAVRDGARVRFVRSVFVPGDEMCFLFFEADSRDTVARVGEAAGFAFDRVVKADA